MSEGQTKAARIDRPDLTMPDQEAATLRAAYEQADVILEYGSGGSTVLAADMPGKHITSVESDRKWARRMRRWFDENPPTTGTTADIVWVNIGKTKAWGHPQDHSFWRRFADYPLAVWQRDGFRHPDVVLVDGRFRAGCALAAAFNITRPVRLLFDDYKARKRHHRVEEFLGAPQLAGRMAIFDVKPLTIPAHRLLQIVNFMIRP